MSGREDMDCIAMLTGLCMSMESKNNHGGIVGDK